MLLRTSPPNPGPSCTASPRSPGVFLSSKGLTNTCRRDCTLCMAGSTGVSFCWRPQSYKERSSQQQEPRTVLQVDADAQEVGGAGRLAALAADAVLDSWGGCHLLGSVDGGRDHLQNVCGAGTDAQSAADAGVVNLHSMGTARQQLGALLASARNPCGCTNGCTGRGHASHGPEGARGISTGAQTRTKHGLLQTRLHLEARRCKGCRAEARQQRDSAGCQAKRPLRHGYVQTRPTAETPSKTASEVTCNCSCST